MKIKLAVVDAIQATRVGIWELAKPTGLATFYGDWASASAFLADPAAHVVEVLLLSVDTGMMHVTDQVSPLLEQYPSLKVIVLARHFSNKIYDELRSLGIMGFVSVHEDLADTLLIALPAVQRGASFTSQHVKAQLADERRLMAALGLSRLHLQHLHAMARFRRASDIARHFGVSTSRVYSAHSELRTKFAVKDNAEVLRKARRYGLLDDEEDVI